MTENVTVGNGVEGASTLEEPFSDYISDFEMLDKIAFALESIASRIDGRELETLEILASRQAKALDSIADSLEQLVILSCANAMYRGKANVGSQISWQERKGYKDSVMPSAKKLKDLIKSFRNDPW